MGSCLGDGRDREVNNELNKGKQIDKQTKKLLFLGSGGSGKSTLFKQLRTIHGTGYNSEDRLIFREHIHTQIVSQMRLALECLEGNAEDDLENKMGDDYKRPDNFNPFSSLSADGQDAVMVVKAVKEPKLNDQIAAACKTLWNEQAIKDIYDQRAVMKIEDTSKYFWDKIDEVMEPNFIPSETDMLLVRFRTTGVIEQRFTIKKNTFHIFDVGGQKSERKKWIHCFENVTAVIFVASLSCYNEVLFEDEGVNSMADQLELFETIVNNRWFEKTSVILFLNKQDLFLTKLQDNKPITLCPKFQDYEGEPFSFEQTTSYIKAMFVDQNNKPDDKSIFTHLTCATDQGNVEKVFNDVQHIIIENSLMSAGLMGDFSEENDGANSEQALM